MSEIIQPALKQDCLPSEHGSYDQASGLYQRLVENQDGSARRIFRDQDGKIQQRQWLDSDGQVYSQEFNIYVLKMDD